MNLTKWKAVLILSIVALACSAVSAQEKPVKATAGQEHLENPNIERITVDELKAKLARNENVVIIDVRGSDYDTSDSRIKGAMRIVPAELSARLKEIPRDKEVITYCACATDGGAVKAAQALLDNGFKRVRALKGGWTAWQQAGGPVELKQK